jgi:hypothetical protein
MRALLLIIAILMCVSSQASAQNPEGVILTTDQQIKTAEIITNIEKTPLANVGFTLAVDAVVPVNVSLRPVPSDAEELAPQLRGLYYVAVEELIGIVEPHSRKIVTVLLRGRRQK